MNKYYTPDISDLFVGYICDHTSMTKTFDERDCNIVLNDDDLIEDEPLTETYLANYVTWGFEYGGLEKFIRTKYLDRQDIESLGWEIDTHRAFFEILKDIPDLEIANKMVDDKVYNIIYHKPNKWLTIKMKNLGGSFKDYPPTNTIYYGECKSLNEFRKIMQYLNIPTHG